MEFRAASIHNKKGFITGQNKDTTCALLEASMARYRNLHHRLVKQWVVLKRKNHTVYMG